MSVESSDAQIFGARSVSLGRSRPIGLAGGRTRLSSPLAAAPARAEAARVRSVSLLNFTCKGTHAPGMTCMGTPKLLYMYTSSRSWPALSAASRPSGRGLRGFGDDAQIRRLSPRHLLVRWKSRVWVWGFFVKDILLFH